MKFLRRLFALVVAWCALTEAVQLFSRLFFHTWVAGDWFLIFLASDSGEMWNFVRLNPGPLAVGILVTLLGLALAVVSLWLPRRWWWSAVGCFIIYAVLGISWLGLAWTPAYLVYDTIRSARTYGSLVSAGKWTAEDEAVAQKALSDPKTRDLPTIILVVGESLTTSRMGVYGYPKDTTPKLTALATNGLEVLPPRKATASYTAKALQDMFAHEGTSFVKSMRRQGYCPVLISGQNHWERYCGVEQMVFSSCVKKRYLRDELQSSELYDWTLVRWAEDEIADTNEPLLLIVHMMGSHYPYSARFPSYWADGEGLDDYDRSVRMTDSVLADLISLVPKNGLLVFTSDHGESPNSASWRNADDPDIWSVPLMVYPKGDHPSRAGVFQSLGMR